MQTGRIDVLGVGFDNLTMDEAVENAAEMIGSRTRGYVVTPNPEIVWLAREDQDFARVLRGASLVLADGIGIIYGAKILKRPLKEKVPGIDFACRLFERLAKNGGSVFLFGAKPGIAEKAAQNIAISYPGIVISGCESGYFDDDAPIIERINAARPDLLLVCLGAPKQEKWMAANARKLDVGIMAGLGGSLDVLSGTVERAPVGWQKLGLEWLHRLLSDPRRIKRMIKLPMFLFAVIGQRIRGR